MLPFIVHEISKVLVFKRLNYSVYELYKYEYKATDVQKVLTTDDVDSDDADTPDER